jgi:hypothetical protein
MSHGLESRLFYAWRILRAEGTRQVPSHTGIFLMTDKAIDCVKETKGWEMGVGSTVVVEDEGVAKNLSTSSLKDDAYASTFNQQGLRPA